MPRQLLIIKTGNTIEPLLAKGEDFEHWFVRGLGLRPEACLVVSLHLGEPLPDLDAVSGIVITGSAAYVTDAADWNYTGAEYLRAARRQSVPVLGVCYGHQLLAWTFGGEVAFHARGREIGTVTIECDAASRNDVLFAELPAVFKAQVSHLQAVTRLPAEAVRLAGNGFDRNHAFRLDDTIWSVQFHPEFSGETVRAYIEHRSGAIAEEGLSVAGLLETVSETPEAAALLRRFADFCARHWAVAKSGVAS